MHRHQSPPVPILSATLEADDVALAQSWLDTPENQWHDLTLVHRWEQTFAHWLGVDTATAWLGGRASLYAAIQALELQPGDEVIVPAFTCQCVVNAFRYQGIVINYADIETDTYGLDSHSVAQMITPETRAILFQYTFGLVSKDISSLLALAKKHQLYIIEDCAHALGATWQGKKLGTFGDVAIFSSERSKIINTIHGGLVTTNNPEIGKRLHTLKQNARLPDIEKTQHLLNTIMHDYALYNASDREETARHIAAKFAGKILPQMFPEEYTGTFTSHYTETINAPIAALSLNQFQKMPRFHPRRLKAAQFWNQWCQKQGLTPPTVIPDSEPTFLRYPVCVSVKKKQNLDWIIQELNVTPGVWFTSAAHPTPLELTHCPVGTKAAQQCINLPTLLPDKYIDDIWRTTTN